MRIVGQADYLSNPAIEKRAHELLASYEAEYGKLVGPPIPIEHIIEGHLQLRIDWEIIEESPGGRILAYLDPLEKRICMNEAQRDFFGEYFGSEAFTYAHEAGHWRLHLTTTDWEQLKLFDDGVLPRKFICRAGAQDRLELQANKFAGAVLMPRWMLRQEIEGRDLTKWPTIEYLRDRFCVSKTAMMIRLQDLDLVKRSQDGSLRVPSQGEVGQMGF